MTSIRIHFSSMAWAMAALLSIVFAGAASAEERWVEGEHYQTLNPPVAVSRGDDVVVTEFFLVRLRSLLHLRTHADSVG